MLRGFRAQGLVCERQAGLGHAHLEGCWNVRMGLLSRETVSQGQTHNLEESHAFQTWLHVESLKADIYRSLMAMIAMGLVGGSRAGTTAKFQFMNLSEVCLHAIYLDDVLSHVNPHNSRAVFRNAMFLAPQ